MYIPLLRSLTSPQPAATAASASAKSAASNPPSASDPTGGLDTMFLQLLSAQLKAQSPIDPLDPNQFVAQLAQFQSLSELTQIDVGIQTLVADVMYSPRASSPSAATENSRSIPNFNFLTH